MTRPDRRATPPGPARHTIHATLPEAVVVGVSAAYPALTGAPWAALIGATTTAAALGVWRIWRLLALQAAAADEETDDDE